ncbi:MAG: hypothetical protein JXR96_14890 [Deltaproteobacteria bacterium]|nr:hypothetical protein [Deltaproteobacteria bacterium]
MKKLVLFAIVCFGAAAYWAYGEGVFDDLLPKKSEPDSFSSFKPGDPAEQPPEPPAGRRPDAPAGRKPDGPAGGKKDGPTSKIPGLAAKTGSSASQGKASKIIQLAFRKLSRGIDRSIDALGQRGSCDERMERSLKVVRALKKNLAKLVKKAERARESMRPEEEAEELARIEKISLTEMAEMARLGGATRGKKAEWRRFTQQCPSQAAALQQQYDALISSMY